MMKLKKEFIACMVVAGLASCEKHNEIYKGDREEIKLTDLVVPADFDWRTTDDVECILTSTAPARVEIYTTPNCATLSRIASLYVDAETEPLKLVIARGVKEVYVRYMDQAGKYNIRPVAILQGKVNFVLPEGCQNFSEIPVKSDDKCSELSELKVEGTVLFEDNYPEKGDYDFNDYVMTYEFKPVLFNGKLKTLEVEIKFVAKGGILPYEPYLRLSGIKYQLMKSIKIDKEDSDKGVGIETFKHLGNDNDLILKFTGVAEAMQRMKTENSEYINTTRDHTTTEDEFIELEFDIDFTGNALEKYKGGDIYDFFLGGEINGEFTEIHERNFSSTRLMTGKEVKKGEYCTKDNFVWVMKIDEDLYDDSKQVGDYEVFPYLNEKDNFLKGYPKFRGYVEAGGKNGYDWCTIANRNDEFLIMFEDD